jgi:hypothetical protein
MKLIGNIMVIGFGLLASCTMLGPSTSSSSYSEDLAVYRPKVEMADTTPETQAQPPTTMVEPENDQTSEIDQKLDQITSNNKTSRTGPGFTIQVYSGTSREEASQAKSKVYKILPDSRPETKYEQPIYRVRVGEFTDRLEAQNIFAELHREFPQAIVIPSRIQIN